MESSLLVRTLSPIGRTSIAPVSHSHSSRRAVYPSNWPHQSLVVVLNESKTSRLAFSDCSAARAMTASTNRLRYRKMEVCGTSRPAVLENCSPRHSVAVDSVNTVDTPPRTFPDCRGHSAVDGSGTRETPIKHDFKLSFSGKWNTLHLHHLYPL